MANTIELMNACSAHNYAPLPVVLVRAELPAASFETVNVPWVEA